MAAGASAAGAKKWWLGELSREANAKGVSLEELPVTPGPTWPRSRNNAI